MNLRDFLKENGAYEAFCTNFRNANVGEEQLLEDFMNSTQVSDDIEQAFTWCETPEGNSYWGKLYCIGKDING